MMEEGEQAWFHRCLLIMLTCDSIPTRRELVKQAARNPTATELKETRKEHLAHRWSTCPVSHKPFVKPVVSDYSGNLYNKDAIIQFLLPTEASSVDKEEYEKFIQGRIRSLKDVVEVQFEVEHDEKTKSDRWICPVTAKELGPSVKAVYVVPCGHAFSLEAIKEMKSDQCIQCGQPYESRDIIPIFPSTEADNGFVIQRIETLRSMGLTHSLKKAGGGKKRKLNGEVTTDARGETKTEGKISRITEIKPAATPPSSTGTPQSGSSTPKLANGIKNAATASLAARVLEEEEARRKRRPANDNIASLYTKTDPKRHKVDDFMTRGFTMPASARHQ